MNRNVEIKARLKDWQDTRDRATRLAAGPARVLRQEDVFFACSHGRLKLRRQSDGAGELIYYDRADQASPRTSHYVIHTTDHPETLAEALRGALGERATVRKERHLFLVGQTRIHLDRVAGLGDFLELEVVLRPGQSEEEGERLARALMDELEVGEDDLESRAYVDLLD